MSLKPNKNEKPLPFETAKEQFLANVMKSAAHDIKTPLASIIGALEIYEHTKDKLSHEKQQSLIRTALQEAYKLNEVINKILEKK